MTVSVRRMTLGAGYRYLMASVAQSDGAGVQRSALTRYYAETGTPPGRFRGAGLSGLAHGWGVEPGAEVAEEHLWRMLGKLQDPVTGAHLGTPPRGAGPSYGERVAARILTETLTDIFTGSGETRAEAVARIKAEEQERESRLPQTVAGFDLTFSAPKSVSVAWGLADPATQAKIYDAHQDALAYVIRYAEQHVLSSRSGRHSVVQEDIRGVVAAAFDHWDSGSGDPQLHTHVVIMNRAQCESDGQWRSLDSRGLFKATVALSEMYNGVLSDYLTQTRVRVGTPDAEALDCPEMGDCRRVGGIAGGVLPAVCSDRGHQEHPDRRVRGRSRSPAKQPGDPATSAAGHVGDPTRQTRPPPRGPGQWLAGTGPRPAQRRPGGVGGHVAGP